MLDKEHRVLWVEDDAQGALAPLGNWLRRSGINLDLATSFDAAERRLRSTKYSAVLLDILIPYAGKGHLFSANLGLRLAKLIREGHYQKNVDAGGTPADIPIVALTVVRRNEIEDDIENLHIGYFDKTMLLEKDYMNQLISALQGS